jgi:hypothetical protein
MHESSMPPFMYRDAPLLCMPSRIGMVWCYRQEQKILFATENTEDTDEAEIP